MTQTFALGPLFLSRPMEELPRINHLTMKQANASVTAQPLARQPFPSLKFGFREDRLEDRAALEQLAGIARGILQAGGGRFRIEGHACDLGNTKHNLELSWRRADFVMTALVRHGVPFYRLRPMGFGCERPLAENDFEINRMRNRRAMIIQEH